MLGYEVGKLLLLGQQPKLYAQVEALRILTLHT